MNRKLRLAAWAAAAALLAAVFSGCARAPAPLPPPPLPESGAQLRLAAATDLHFLTPSLVREGEAFTRAYTGGDGKQLNYSSQLTDAFLSQLLREKPDAVLLTGDLTLNGERESHRDLAGRLRALREAGIRVLVIPGNHDINNRFASGYNRSKTYSVRSVTPEEFAELYGECGYGDALSRDSASLSYIAELSQDLWAVMLDTNRYDETGGLGFPVNAGAVRPETLVWLREQLGRAKEAGVQVISATHHSLLDHSSRLRSGYTLDNCQELLKLYEEYGVRVNLSGHVHIQDIACSREGGEEVWDIATSSLAVYTNQYGEVDYIPRRELRYRTREVDVEGWAAETGSTDPNLLDFERYSYDFFYEAAYWRSYGNLYMAQLGEGADLYLMAKTMALLNPAYFSGTAGEIREEILASDHYAMWRAYSGFAPIEYINSMLEVRENDPCRAVISMKE